MRKLYPLTDEERDFATENYEIVTRFLRKKRFPENEYFDVVIFGFLEAVQREFRSSYSTEKKNFTALAEICMKHAVGESKKPQKRLKRKGTTYSFDANIGNENYNFYDVLFDETQNVEMEVEASVLLESLLSLASKRQKQALEMAYAGFSPSEIASYMGIKDDTARHTLYNFRKKARKVMP